MPKDFGGIINEFKGGKLHSGSSNGPVVKNKAQAIAIALSEKRQQSKKLSASNQLKALKGSSE